ncbi:hypothetical protein K9M48_03040 [Candidatus Gracilibacteria bacterium]|nr:hypothetical protein [Candidatus Gracilibacteria bacterium]
MIKQHFAAQTLYDTFITNISNKIGFSILHSEYLIWGIAIYISLLILLGFIHTLTQKYYKKSKQNFFYECDYIIKQLATFQYQNKKNNNINIQLVKTIFDSQSKDYFKEAKNIKIKIKEIENNINQNLIENKQRSKFQKHYKKTKRLMIFSNTIGRIITILTIGTYKVFR